MSDTAAEKIAGVDPAGNGAAAPAPKATAKAWEWIEGEKPGVRFGEKLFAFAPAAPGKVEEYAERLLEITEAYRSMLRARQNFENGLLATYENAWEKSRQIFRECRMAEAALRETTAEISGFFEPAGVALELRRDSKLLKAFIEETLERLAAKI